MFVWERNSLFPFFSVEAKTFAFFGAPKEEKGKVQGKINAIEHHSRMSTYNNAGQRNVFLNF